MPPILSSVIMEETGELKAVIRLEGEHRVGTILEGTGQAQPTSLAAAAAAVDRRQGGEEQGVLGDTLLVVVAAEAP